MQHIQIKIKFFVFKLYSFIKVGLKDIAKNNIRNLAEMISQKCQQEFKSYRQRCEYYQQWYQAKTSQQDTQIELLKKIEKLTKQIDKIKLQLDEEYQLIRRKKTFVNNQNSMLSSNETGDQFSHVFYLREIKKPLQQVQPPKQKQNMQLSQASFNYDNIMNLKIENISRHLIPNHQIQIQFEFKHLQPILRFNQSIYKLQNIPNRFKIHLHHLNNHCQTQLCYQPKYGLYEKQKNITVGKNNHIIIHFDSKKDDSAMILKLKYQFRTHNIDLYKKLFYENQNIIFSIQDTSDETENKMIIAMTKINFNQLFFESKNYLKGSSNLIKKQFQMKLYIRKIISLTSSLPIEEMPLVCKIQTNVKIQENILSPSIQDLEELNFVIRQPIKRANVFERDQSHRKKMHKSPLKSLSKSPFKNSSKQPYYIEDSSLGKSPHHKRSYIKKLLTDGKPTQKQRNTKPQLKFQRISTMDGLELKLYPKQKSYLKSLSIRYFSELYLHLIEDDVHNDSINIDTYNNIDIATYKLKSEIKYKDEIQKNSQNHNKINIQESDIYKPRQFTIQLTLKANLKDPFKQGSIKLILPYLQKLYKRLGKIPESGNQYPYSILITIQPNTLFSIEPYENVMEMTRSKSSIKKSVELNASKEFKKNEQILKKDQPIRRNKFIRIYQDLYVYSEYLNDIHCSKNFTLQKFQSQFIHSVYFKSSFDNIVDQKPAFSILPFGTIFKVSSGGTAHSYLINFKVNFQDYIYYKQNKSQLKQQKQLKKQKQNLIQDSILIQMGICLTAHVQQNKKTVKRTQIQYFDCELYTKNKQADVSTPYTVLKLNQKDHFYELSMTYIIKPNQQVTIYCPQSNILSVVNGQNVIISSQQDYKLLLQLHKTFQKGTQKMVHLIVDNWDKKNTFLIRLCLIHKDPLEQSIIRTSDIGWKQSQIGKSSVRKKQKIIVQLS